MKPVIQICGYKNSGKTTLISGLLAILNQMNIRTAIIKHDLHGFEGDVEDTDTYRLRNAGAAATAITSPWRTAIVEEHESSLASLIDHFQSYDLILVEGFKHEPHPKLVMVRHEEDMKLVSTLTHVAAVICRTGDLTGCEAVESNRSGQSNEQQEQGACHIPAFYAHEVHRIAEFITTQCGIGK